MDLQSQGFNPSVGEMPPWRECREQIQYAVATLRAATLTELPAEDFRNLVGAAVKDIEAALSQATNTTTILSNPQNIQMSYSEEELAMPTMVPHLVSSPALSRASASTVPDPPLVPSRCSSPPFFRVDVREGAYAAPPSRRASSPFFVASTVLSSCRANNTSGSELEHSRTAGDGQSTQQGSRHWGMALPNDCHTCNPNDMQETCGLNAAMLKVNPGPATSVFGSAGTFWSMRVPAA